MRKKLKEQINDENISNSSKLLLSNEISKIDTELYRIAQRRKYIVGNKKNRIARLKSVKNKLSANSINNINPQTLARTVRNPLFQNNNPDIIPRQTPEPTKLNKLTSKTIKRIDDEIKKLDPTHRIPEADFRMLRQTMHTVRSGSTSSQTRRTLQAANFDYEPRRRSSLTGSRRGTNFSIGSGLSGTLRSLGNSIRPELSQNTYNNTTSIGIAIPESVGLTDFD